MSEITQKTIFEIIKNNKIISVKNIAKLLNSQPATIYDILYYEMQDICDLNIITKYVSIREYFATTKCNLCFCPICKKIMKKKVSSSGIYRGEYFWGCSKYPECDCLVTIVQRSRLREFCLEYKIIDE
ncbi:MAG: hypothetical protein IKI95_01905 [Clostridia bacterium]|nr:hypothetical protein [Clostridia bacterium]